MPYDKAHQQRCEVELQMCGWIGCLFFGYEGARRGKAECMDSVEVEDSNWELLDCAPHGGAIIMGKRGPPSGQTGNALRDF